MAIRIAIETGTAEKNLQKLSKDLLVVTKRSDSLSKETELLSKDMSVLAKETGLTEKKLSTLERRMLSKLHADQTSEAFKRMSKSLGMSRLEAAKYQAQLGHFDTSLRTLGGSFDNLKGKVFSLQTAFATLGIAAVVKDAVNNFSEFDKGLIGISKTTNLAGSHLVKLGDDILDLSKELPIPRKELMDIAQAAGQLGIHGSRNLLKFSKTVGQLGLATDLHGEEAAMILARMLTIAGESAQSVDVLGSAIVALGNNLPATEREIALVALQIGQATAEFNIASTSAAGMAGAIRSIGVRAELAGSAIGRAFRGIRNSIDEGGEGLQLLSQITGMTGDELRKTFKEDATKVFLEFERGVGKMIKSGEAAPRILEKFGLRGEEIMKVIPTLAIRVNELEKALNLANRETENATALTTEAELATSGFEAQMQLVSNRVGVVSKQFGEELAPAILDVSREFASFLENNETGIKDMGSELGEVVKTVGGLTLDITKGYNTLPEPVKAGGLVGAALMGPKGWAALGAVSFLAGRVKNISDAITLVRGDMMSVRDFATMTGSELDEALKKYDEVSFKQARINKLRSQARTAIYAEDQKRMRDEAQALEDSLTRDALESSRKRHEAIEDQAFAIAEATNKKKIAIEKTIEGEKKGLSEKTLLFQGAINKKIASMNQDSYERQIANVEAIAKAYRARAGGIQSTLDLITQYEITSYGKITKERVKNESKSITNFRDRLDTEQQLSDQYYNQLRVKYKGNQDALNQISEEAEKTSLSIERRRNEKLEKERLDAAKSRAEKVSRYEEELIKRAIEVRNQSGGQGVSLERHRLIEQKKLALTFARNEKERIGITRSINRQLRELDKKEYQQKQDNAENFFEYVHEGLKGELKINQNIADDETEIWKDMYDEIGGFVDGVRSKVTDSFAGLFSGLMRGELVDFKDFFEEIMSSIVDSFINSVARMAAEYATAKIFEAGGSLINSLPFFHDGNLKADEGLAVLQEGEMVVPAKQSDAIRQAVSGDGLSKRDFFNRIEGSVSEAYGSPIGKIDSMTQNRMGTSIQSIEQAKMQASFIGNAKASTLAGISSAVSSYQNVQKMGQMAGAPQDVIDSVAKSQSINSFMSTFSGGFTGGVVGDAITASLGVDDPGLFSDVNIGGFSFDPDSMLSMAAATGLSIALGGIPAPFMAAAVVPAVKFGISAIADALDMRDDETLRDKIEDAFGQIGGRRVYSAFKENITPSISMPGSYMFQDDVKKDFSILSTDEVVDALKNNLADNKQLGLQQLMRRAVTLGGYNYTKSVFASGSAMERTALAKDVQSRMGYYGYDTRTEAAKNLGQNMAYGNSVYTATGKRVNKGSFFGHIAGTGGWGRGDNQGDGPSHGQKSAGPSDSASQTGRGYGGTPGLGGFQSGGVVNRLVIPNGDDGLAALQYGETVLTKNATEFAAKLNQGEVPNVMQNMPNITIQLVTESQEVLKSFIVDTTRELSERGVALVNTKGVYVGI